MRYWIGNALDVDFRKNKTFIKRRDISGFP